VALTGAKAYERPVLTDLTTTGVYARIAQRILALTAAIWHNDHLGLTIRRSPTAYDHGTPRTHPSRTACCSATSPGPRSIKDS